MNTKETQNNMNDKMNNGEFENGGTFQEDDSDKTVYMKNDTSSESVASPMTEEDDSDKTVYMPNSTQDYPTNDKNNTVSQEDDEEGTAYMMPGNGNVNAQNSQPAIQDEDDATVFMGNNNVQAPSYEEDDSDKTVYMAPEKVNNTPPAEADYEATEYMNPQSVQNSQNSILNSHPVNFQNPNSGMAQYPKQGAQQYPDSAGKGYVQQPPQSLYQGQGVPQYPSQTTQGQYPNSVMPQYPAQGSGQYPPQSTPYPNTNSGMTYYQQQGMTYCQPPEVYMANTPKKKMSTAKFAAIFACIVLCAAIAAGIVLVVLKAGKNEAEAKKTFSDDDDYDVTEVITDDSYNAEGKEDEKEANEETQQQVSEDKVTEDDNSKKLPRFESFKEFEVENSVIKIDGEMYDFPEGLYNMDDVDYVSVAQIFDLFEIDVDMDEETCSATVEVDGNIFVMTHGEVEGLKTDSDGKTSRIPLTRPPIMFSNGEMFASVKGLSEVLGFKSVDWDNGNDCIKITTKTVKIP